MALFTRFNIEKGGVKEGGGKQWWQCYNGGMGAGQIDVLCMCYLCTSNCVLRFQIAVLAPWKR